MPLFLDKLLILFVLPLGTTVGAGLSALVMFALGRHRGAAVLALSAVAWIWGWSTPFAAMALIGPLSDPYPVRRVETLPAADAIVLLGGNLQPISGDMLYPNLSSTADRIWHAARLYDTGKAPLIIVSAGNVWGDRERSSEADATSMLLEALGVPADAVVLDRDSRNTRQNAVFTERIATGRGIARVLLVTSHWHLRRAEAAFRRVGMEVIPVATDHGGSTSDKPGIFMFIPQTESLKFNSVLLKEHLGYLVYRLRGWV